MKKFLKIVAKWKATSEDIKKAGNLIDKKILFVLVDNDLEEYLEDKKYRELIGF